MNGTAIKLDLLCWILDLPHVGWLFFIGENRQEEHCCAEVAVMKYIIQFQIRRKREHISSGSYICVVRVP